MRVAIGCDHVGFPQKGAMVDALQQAGHAVLDLGAHGTDPVDYPILARAVANAVLNQFVDLGILICETGTGASIAANKVKGVRAAIGYDVAAARASRAREDANLLCVPANGLAPESAIEIAKAWLAAQFEGDERALRQLAQIGELEQGMAQGTAVVTPPRGAGGQARGGDARPKVPPSKVAAVETYIASLGDENLKALAARALAFFLSRVPGAEGAPNPKGDGFCLTLNAEHAATVYIGKGYVSLEAGPDRIPSNKIKDLDALEMAMHLPSIDHALQAFKQP